MLKNKINLYIVRHGETEWNVLQKFQGQLNSPLTISGIKKVEETAKKIRNIIFDAVYTSQLERTVETAEIILNYNKSQSDFKRLAELNEVYFGDWQGMTFEEIFKEYPIEANNYFYNVKEYNAKNINGEELSDSLDRFILGLDLIVDNALNENKEFNSTKNILIITHGTVLELFLNYVTHKTLNLDERTLISNGDYRIFSINEENKYILLEKSE